jgi:type VI secretion system protein VasD
MKVDGKGMIRRRVLLRWACCGAGAILAGCGSDEEPPPAPAPPPPPMPTVVSLTLTATPDVNPTETGEARPVGVRVLRLASVDDFLETGFFELDSDPKGVLGDDLIAEDTFTLAPGSTQIYQRQFEDDARFVAVMAAYRDIESANWRGFFNVPRNRTTLLTADLNATGLSLREAGL